jgi:hypothetical protein
MVIFARGDSTGKGGYDLNYLNPIIFYRAVESNNGSFDNSLIAFDGYWIPCKGFMAYGQFILDEFNLNRIKSQPNWWANKYGYQLGIKAINAFVKNLDIRVEYNRVRPYTYSHYNAANSYSHFNQPLAHPLGSNFEEASGDFIYRPWYALTLNVRYIYAVKGNDSLLNGTNYGSNILRSSDSRVSDNVLMYSGLKSRFHIIDLNVSYMLYHNLFIDLKYQNRRISGLDLKNSGHWYGLGIRFNTSSITIDH